MIYIKIFFIKLKFSKNKFYSKILSKPSLNVVDYIQKYKYIFDIEVNTKTVSGYENVIWTCWFQGKENAPPIIKCAMNTMSKYNSKHPIIVITEQNLNKYIELPSFIKDKYDKKIISWTHLSDYVRVCLLAKYGGVWVDASCYFTNKIPDIIWKIPFFQFKNSHWFALKEIPNSVIWKLIDRYYNQKNFEHTRSNWFLRAKPNSAIINKMKQLLEEYWKYENTLIDYFIFHYFLTFVIKNDKFSQKEFNKIPQKYNNVYPHLLQNAFSEEFNEKILLQIKKNSFVHKLKWQEVKSSNKNDFLAYLLA